MDEKHSKDFPYGFELVSPQENEELSEFLRGYKEEFVRVGPKKYFLQRDYEYQAANIYNFPVRTDDTYVASYPKSGTTLTQELVWLIGNNLDYKKAEATILTKRYSFLEYCAAAPKYERSCAFENQKELLKTTLLKTTPEDITELPSPRFIKTHLAMSLLPPSLLDAKVVYVARDPRDVAVSYFHHHKLTKMTKPEKEFKPFWNYFVSGNMFWAPYFGHVLEAWEKRNHPNMLFLFYEEITKDLPGSIRRIASFLNRTFSEEQVNELVNHVGIEKFKKNKSVNFENLQKNGIFSSDGAFIRNGGSGGWRDYFDQEMKVQAEKWIEENIRGTDFRFPH